MQTDATVRVAGAQLNLVVGDIDGNVARLLAAMAWAESVGADWLLTPELAITGYPPEDLLHRSSFVSANLDALEILARESGRVATVIGFVDRVEPSRARTADRLDDAVPRRLANAAAIVSGGRVAGVYHKQLLPNYGVFDEDRYFVPGTEAVPLWRAGSTAAGVSVCEDIWVPDGPPSQQAASGAAILLNINASPYHRGKGEQRRAMLAARAKEAGVPLVYVNLVGGQDELVFDGDSMVFDGTGSLLHRGPQFEEAHLVWDVPVTPVSAEAGADVVVSPGAADGKPALPPRSSFHPLAPTAELYTALQVGLRDYVQKNGFDSVVIGLSGGIDSAVTAVIAADALGPDSVHGITMPSRYSSRGSVEDSRELARRLGIRFDEVPIDDVFESYLQTLAPLFAGRPPGVAEENLQARIRGAVLMALSNKFGGMVVATGNKSEMAVGYATLYGDMAGGFAVLKDVYKTDVYALAAWRNEIGDVIPDSIITKPPSAELRPDQLDTDSLPPYDVLDRILEQYIEQDAPADDIVAAGHPRELVARITAMVDRNEYKRRQSAPGVKVTKKAFGKDRRLPITNGWRRR